MTSEFISEHTKELKINTELEITPISMNQWPFASQKDLEPLIEPFASISKTFKTGFNKTEQNTTLTFQPDLSTCDLDFNVRNETIFLEGLSMYQASTLFFLDERKEKPVTMVEMKDFLGLDEDETINQLNPLLSRQLIQVQPTPHKLESYSKISLNIPDENIKLPRSINFSTFGSTPQGASQGSQILSESAPNPLSDPLASALSSQAHLPASSTTLTFGTPSTAILNKPSKHTLESLIIHFIKHQKKALFSEILTQANEKLSKLTLSAGGPNSEGTGMVVDEKDITRCLDNLINMDYVARDQVNSNLFVYLP